MRHCRGALPVDFTAGCASLTNGIPRCSTGRNSEPGNAGNLANTSIALRNAQVRRISWVRGVRPARERCEWPPHDTVSGRPPFNYSVTLRCERSEPRRATAAKSAIADLDTNTPKSGKPDFGWHLGRILRGPLRGHLRMTGNKQAPSFSRRMRARVMPTPFAKSSRGAGSRHA